MVAKKILILALILALSMVISNSITLPRHVDPTQVKGEPLFSIGFILYYARLINLLTEESFDVIKEELGNILKSLLPEWFVSLIRRFEELLSELSDILKEIKQGIERAESFLTEGEVELAREELNLASKKLKQAKTGLERLDKAAKEMAEKLRVELKPLLNNLNQLRDLIKLYEERIKMLKEELEKPKIRTSITIEVDSAEVWVGENILVSGYLTTEEGQPLPNRTLRIRLASKVILTKTDDLGFYNKSITVPYVYVPSLTLSAFYLPEAKDKEVYLPSTSETITIKTLYLEPKIEAYVPNETFPSKQMLITGKLKLNDKPLEDFLVTVTGFGEKTTATTDETGFFQLYLSVPSKMKEGLSEIILASEPKGKVGPSFITRYVSVVRLPIKVLVNVPMLVLAGQTFNIKGQIISNEGPIFNASVTLTIYNEFYKAFTNFNGEFEIKASLPPTAPTGRYDINVNVTPAQPWFKEVKLKLEMQVINLMVLLIPIGIGTFLASRLLPKRRKVRILKHVKESLKPLVKEASTYDNQIINMYYDVVKILSSRFGKEQKVSQTIREYLIEVKEVMDGVYDKFETLTFISEKILYYLGISDEERSLAFNCYKTVLEYLHES